MNLLSHIVRKTIKSNHFKRGIKIFDGHNHKEENLLSYQVMIDKLQVFLSSFKYFTPHSASSHQSISKLLRLLHRSVRSSSHSGKMTSRSPGYFSPAQLLPSGNKENTENMVLHINEVWLVSGRRIHCKLLHFFLCCLWWPSRSPASGRTVGPPATSCGKMCWQMGSRNSVSSRKSIQPSSVCSPLLMPKKAGSWCWVSANM